MIATAPLTKRIPAWVPLALASLALATRTISNEALLVLLAAAVVGLIVPVVRPRPASAMRWAGVTVAGCGVFALSRGFGPAVGVGLDLLDFVAVIGAGIAEEALFRRGMYGVIERRAGALAAVVATAVVFAVIHVPMYGWNTLALNVTAGLVLGWQRWASRSWSSPAVTHVVANLLQARWL